MRLSARGTPSLRAMVASPIPLAAQVTSTMLATEVVVHFHSLHLFVIDRKSTGSIARKRALDSGVIMDHASKCGLSGYLHQRDALELTCFALPNYPSGPMPLNNARRFTIPILQGLLGFFLCTGVLPANATYQVTVAAPKPLQQLLTEFLDLVRYKDRTDLEADQFDFMILSVPQQVTKLSATEGYFAPKTVVKIEKTLAGTTMVQVTVEPGLRTTVSTLDLQINGAVVSESPQQLARLRQQWLLKPGQPFRQDDWASSKQDALRVLRSERYAAAEIGTSTASIHPDTSLANLAVGYDSGPRFTLGAIKVEGVHRYREQIIHNINPLIPGEQYSEARLLELQRLIQKTPYFSNAIVDIERDRQNAAMAPVNVRVTEFPTQQIRAGAGFTTNTGAHVNGVYSHNDVFGRAWVFESQAKIEQQRQFAGLDLSMPPDGNAFINNIPTAFERTTQEGIDLRSRRAGLRRTRSTETDDFAYTLEYYNDQLRQLDGAALPADTVVQPGSHHAVVAGVAWTRRQVDDRLFPRRGHLLALELGAALRGLLTDQTFFRAHGKAQQYFPFRQRDVLLLRGELGIVASAGGNASIPASLLFRAGGTDSVRGYSYQSIGNTSNGTVYPTRYLATGSVEYQHWLDTQWGAAVFYDIGTATDRWSDKTFLQAIGAGARWRSPVGTVNADLAYGIEAHQIRPHVSLGVSF